MRASLNRTTPAAQFKRKKSNKLRRTIIERQVVRQQGSGRLVAGKPTR